MKILLSTFGSAGDLFPLMPIMVELRGQGHDIHGATSPAFGLYLRASGIRTIALGRDRRCGSSTRTHQRHGTLVAQETAVAAALDVILAAGAR